MMDTNVSIQCLRPIAFFASVSTELDGPSILTITSMNAFALNYMRQLTGTCKLKKVCTDIVLVLTECRFETASNQGSLGVLLWCLVMCSSSL